MLLLQHEGNFKVDLVAFDVALFDHDVLILDPSTLYVPQGLGGPSYALLDGVLKARIRDSADPGGVLPPDLPERPTLHRRGAAPLRPNRTPRDDRVGRSGPVDTAREGRTVAQSHTELATEDDTPLRPPRPGGRPRGRGRVPHGLFRSVGACSAGVAAAARSGHR